MQKTSNSLSIHRAIQQITRDEPLSVTVKGVCMMPWIETGSRVDISPASFYWPGDVVVALSNDSHFLVHRVIGGYWRSGKFKVLTQADSALRPDMAVLPGDILGRVTGGSCHPHAVSIPVTHRLKALLRFGRFISKRVRLD
jgi:hypothetical protein